MEGLCRKVGCLKFVGEYRREYKSTKFGSKHSYRYDPTYTTAHRPSSVQSSGTLRLRRSETRVVRCRI